MAVTPPRETRCDEASVESWKNGHPLLLGVMAMLPTVPVMGPSTRPTVVELPSSMLVPASRPSAVARQPATDSTRHDAGSPVSWNGNFTAGFAVAANLTCAATFTMAAAGMGVPRRETDSVAQARRAYSQASTWPSNQKADRPAMAGARRDRLAAQPVFVSASSQSSSGWCCLRRPARTWAASRLQVPRAQTVSENCPFAAEPTSSCSCVRVEWGLLTLRGTALGSQPKAA